MQLNAQDSEVQDGRAWDPEPSHEKLPTNQGHSLWTSYEWKKKTCTLLSHEISGLF